MIRFRLLFCAAAFLLASTAAAGPTTKSPFGIGAELPISLSPAYLGLGLSGKYWFNYKEAVDMSLYGGSGYVALGADYLWHFYNVFSGEAARRMPMHLGAGGGVLLANGYVGAAVQGKLGIDYLFREPFDIFLDMVPRVNIVGGFGFGIGLNLGGRWYF